MAIFTSRLGSSLCNGKSATTDDFCPDCGRYLTPERHHYAVHAVPAEPGNPSRLTA